MHELFKAKKHSDHPYSWVWESLEGMPGFALRTLFGTKAVYFDGRIVLCCTAKEEPWRGILVCTEREHHAALTAAFPALVPHPILSKWLYLSEATDAFEETATRLIALVRRRDPRIGVLPKPKRSRKAVRFTKTDHP